MAARRGCTANAPFIRRIAGAAFFRPAEPGFRSEHAACAHPRAEPCPSCDSSRERLVHAAPSDAERSRPRGKRWSAKAVSPTATEEVGGGLARVEHKTHVGASRAKMCVSVGSVVQSDARVLFTEGARHEDRIDDHASGVPDRSGSVERRARRADRGRPREPAAGGSYRAADPPVGTDGGARVDPLSRRVAHRVREGLSRGNPHHARRGR